MGPARERGHASWGKGLQAVGGWPCTSSGWLAATVHVIATGHSDRSGRSAILVSGLYHIYITSYHIPNKLFMYILSFKLHNSALRDHYPHFQRKNLVTRG